MSYAAQRRPGSELADRFPDFSSLLLPTFSEADARSRQKRVLRVQQYYLDPKGRNYALYPGFAAEFRRRTRRLDPDAYELGIGQAAAAAA